MHLISVELALKIVRDLIIPQTPTWESPNFPVDSPSLRLILYRRREIYLSKRITKFYEFIWDKKEIELVLVQTGKFSVPIYHGWWKMDPLRQVQKIINGG